MNDLLRRWIDLRRAEADEHEERAAQIEFLLRHGVGSVQVLRAELKFERLQAESLRSLAVEIERAEA